MLDIRDPSTWISYVPKASLSAALSERELTRERIAEEHGGCFCTHIFCVSHTLHTHTHRTQSCIMHPCRIVEERDGSNRFIAQGVMHLVCMYLWRCTRFVERFELQATPAASIRLFLSSASSFHKLFASLPSGYRSLTRLYFANGAN